MIHLRHERTDKTMIDTLFQFAAASVQGRDHVVLGKNNQDAFLVHTDPEGALLLVADGCGSGTFSESGAQIGTRLFGAALRREILFAKTQPETAADWQQLLNVATQSLVKSLRSMIRRFEPLTVDPHDFFLFTLVGAWIGPKQTVLFACGDGYWALNGELKKLAPHEGNEPDYLGYALDGEEVDVRVLTALPTAEVKTLMIGTDGLDMWPEIATHNLPGKTDKVGALEQFWMDAQYVQNPDALRRKLTLINRTMRLAHWETKELEKIPGLLKDDTTLIIARRRDQP